MDLLRRLFALNDYKVKLVMNITDVGHLTDDADAGDDKMIVAMQREGKTAKQIAEFYTQAFLEDIDDLEIGRPDEIPKATEHIEEQIKMIEQLEKRGFTYRTADGIYFDTSLLDSYGRLSGQKAEDKKAGARVEMGEKKHATDFALWKLSVRKDAQLERSEGSSKRLMEWTSPWGKGFPGWHIECSAMSAKYLKIPFDIHTGGVDHIAVHHENELAQTKAAFDKLEANVWMHSEFLTVDGGKMSKSLKNIYTMFDLEKKGFTPLAYRYFTLSAHYRTKLNFTFEALQAAQSALLRLYSLVRNWDKPTKKGNKDYEQKFFAAVNDDLNMPEALAVLWQLVEDKKMPTREKAMSILLFDEILGLRLNEYVAVPEEIPEEIVALVKEREQARADKDWALSDELRDQIVEKGFAVEDTANGTHVHSV